MRIADADNVDRGAALLDARLPGWRDAIDADTLELRFGCQCVLGQLFKDYDTGVAVLGLTDDQAKSFGFTRDRSAWSALTRAWRRVVA